MFETERLILRPMNEADIPAIFAMRSDPEVMKFIREPQSEQESANWLKLVSSKWGSDKIGFCGVIEKDSGNFAGWCGLWQLRESGEIEIGYAIAKQFWKKGYAVEASWPVLEYGFLQLGLEKIVAVAWPENKGSRRVMEKLGMEFDHIGKYYDLDLVHYSIKKDDFIRNRTIAA